MRIAVALFGHEVSPRWCAAREALLATVTTGVIEGRERLELGECSNAVRLGRLHGCGVSVLVCGGFDRRYLPLAEQLGIRVVWGVKGGAEEALRTLAGTPVADVRFRAGEPSSAATHQSPRENSR